jgi:uncharacterized membrane protein
MAIGKRITALAFIGFGITAAAGCAYDKKEVIQVPCTIPTTVTYTARIEPIIRNNCYRCHSAATLISGIQLDSYAALKAYAQNGKLYGVTSHAPGFRPMPDDGGKLDDCSLALIKKWIDTGTPEN